MGTRALRVPVDPAHDHCRGPDEPDVTLLMYGDYQCSYTRLAHQAIAALASGMPRLRFCFRHLPLTELHPRALACAGAAEAAGRQGRFWAMHDVLFEQQARVRSGELRSFARIAGLDVERFDEDIQDDALWARVRDDVQGAIDSGVRGTPALFVDGWAYNGPYEVDRLESMLAATRAARLPA